MRQVTISLDEMLASLPRYGIGQSGQCFVRYDDVVQTVNAFFRAKHDIEKRKKP